MSRVYKWSEENIALLGTISDYAIAKRLGICRDTVYWERKRRGIEPWRLHKLPDSIWSPTVISKMGEISDKSLADEIGVSQATVSTKRQMLGIPSFVTHRAWDAGEVAMLGTAPDKEVAQLIGREVEHVRAARQFRGIPVHRAERWVESVAHQLGVIIDADIAAAVGVLPEAVANARRKRGIPPARQYKGENFSSSPPRSRQRKPWAPEEISLLGKISDAEVARRTGRTKSGVTMERHNRRITGIDPAKATQLYKQARAQE